MPTTTDALPEVYSASEIAQAAGVDAGAVVRWGHAHNVRSLPGGFYGTPEAVRMVRHLLATIEAAAPRLDLFERAAGPDPRSRVPIAIATSLHMALVAGLALMMTAAGPLRSAGTAAPQTTQLVFLAMPGGGGGGGGGGRRVPTRASAAERKGVSRLRSPIPQRRFVGARAPSIVEPRPPAPAPAVAAPVVPAAADERETAGEPVQAPRQPESRGPGSDGEAGSAHGGGIGAGSGPGLNDGTGGGTGGGPYRPGSGIAPPSLLREVKPDYTEEGRRRNVEGEVELEIVVRSDGSVGDVRMLRGLGAGLDERAADAVRQWRFSPATKQGVPVDVVVEVSVEFRLR